MTDTLSSGGRGYARPTDLHMTRLRTMKTTWRVVAVIGLAAALGSCGCGKAHKPPAPTPVTKSDVPLPEWAPKNPSPEFLRAAKVLKPIPQEQGAEAAPEAAALFGRLRTTWVPAYEFFGSLTDGQTKRFLSTRKLRVPVKSLRAEQRGALDRWFATWRQAMRGSELEDWLVQLYKTGARHDLSNVEVGFATVPVGTSSEKIVSTHRVHLWFWIKKPNGSTVETGCAFAQI